MHYLQRAARVMARVQDGNDLSDAQGAALANLGDSDFVTRMKGSGLVGRLAAPALMAACRRLGLNREREGLYC